jgi:PAS domain-containing protein
LRGCRSRALDDEVLDIALFRALATVFVQVVELAAGDFAVSASPICEAVASGCVSSHNAQAAVGSIPAARHQVASSPCSAVNILSFPNVSRNDGQLLLPVLNNMSQGVLLFDSDLKLVICNLRYIEMYGLSQKAVKPGCSLRDLLNSRIKVGTFSGDPVDYIAKLAKRVAEGKVFSSTSKLADGRIVSLASKPIYGGGWLLVAQLSAQLSVRQDQDR